MCARSQTSGDCSGEIWRVSCSSDSGSSRFSVRCRACSRATTSSDGDTELGKTDEDERRDHRSLTDRSCDTLRRAVPNVTCGEETHAARLEREWITIERPAVRQAVVLEQILSGQNVAR